jgi:hypothetical protein
MLACLWHTQFLAFHQICSVCCISYAFTSEIFDADSGETVPPKANQFLESEKKWGAFHMQTNNPNPILSSTSLLNFPTQGYYSLP